MHTVLWDQYFKGPQHKLSEYYSIIEKRTLYHGPLFPIPLVQYDTILKMILQQLEKGMLKPIHERWMGIFIHNLKMSQHAKDYQNQCDFSRTFTS